MTDSKEEFTERFRAQQGASAAIRNIVAGWDAPEGEWLAIKQTWIRRFDQHLAASPEDATLNDLANMYSFTSLWLSATENGSKLYPDDETRGDFPELDGVREVLATTGAYIHQVAHQESPHPDAHEDDAPAAPGRGGM